MMDIYQKALIAYYNDIVSEEMHWTYTMHCIVEDGNLSDGDLDISVSGVTYDEFAVIRFLRSMPYEVRRFIWENHRENMESSK